MRKITTTTKVLFAIALILLVLDVAVGRPWGWPWAVIGFSAALYPNRWSVVLAVVLAVATGLAKFHVIPMMVAVFCEIALVLLMIVNAIAHYRPKSHTS